MNLSNIKRPEGARKNRKRIGRGHSSGWGKTSGKGHKGQNARSGGGVSAFFEGGQMPLVRRLPKFGFTNPSRIEAAVVNVGRLSIFDEGSTIDIETFRSSGLVKGKKNLKIKILGNGEFGKKLTVKAHAFSKSAIESIEKAGGTAEIIQ